MFYLIDKSATLLLFFCSLVVTAFQGPLSSVPQSHHVVKKLRGTYQDVAEKQRKDSVELLSDALGVFNSSSATDLMLQITEMRKDSSTQEMVGQYLDDLLQNGPDGPLPVWSRIRITSRFSKRARFMSLRRLLNLSSPPLAEGEQREKEGANDELRQQRRRRALVSVIQSLCSVPENNAKELPAVVELEKRARKASTAISDSEDIRGRLPSGLETPEYSILGKKKMKGGTVYEIRRYKPYSVCSVMVNQPRPKNSEKTDAKVSLPQLTGASSFGALAGYLFGKNQESTSMKMTTPVLMTGEDSSRQMSFVLPSDYWGSDSIKQAPRPYAESGVKLEEVKGGEKAAIMFGGYASKSQVEKRKKQLLQALAKDKEWEAITDEPISTAQYNDPFTPPWKRLNEVSIGVVPRQT